MTAAAVLQVETLRPNRCPALPRPEPLRFYTTRTRNGRSLILDTPGRRITVTVGWYRDSDKGQHTLTAFTGDDRRDTLVFEPAEQATQLGAQDSCIGEAAE